MSQTTLEEAESTTAVIGAMPEPTEEQKVMESAKEAVDAEFEIAIEDDTPEEDRNKEVMPKEIVQDLEKDELDEYSKEKGKQLKKVWHDERRAKEAAFKERDAAAHFSKRLLEENKILKSHLTVGEQALIDNSKSNAEHEVELAKKSFKEAYDSGDSEAVTAAQEALVSAKIKLSSAEAYVPQYSEEVLAQQEQATQQAPQGESSQKEPSSEDLAWQDRNKEWFGPNDAMTSLAFGLHTSLMKEHGAEYAGTPAYYEQIDNEMRLRYPDYFKDTEETSPSPKGNQSQSTVVSPVKRTTSPKRVVLSNSEVRLAQRLGLSPEQYVREKMKLEA